MAMILRLQKEKSEIEIEARQYKRMTEEKSVYDLEEMEILKGDNCQERNGELLFGERT
jgi:Zein-binding